MDSITGSVGFNGSFGALWSVGVEYLGAFLSTIDPMFLLVNYAFGLTLYVLLAFFKNDPKESDEGSEGSEQESDEEQGSEEQEESEEEYAERLYDQLYTCLYDQMYDEMYKNMYEDLYEEIHDGIRKDISLELRDELRKLIKEYEMLASDETDSSESSDSSGSNKKHPVQSPLVQQSPSTQNESPRKRRKLTRSEERRASMTINSTFQKGSQSDLMHTAKIKDLLGQRGVNISDKKLKQKLTSKGFTYVGLVTINGIRGCGYSGIKVKPAVVCNPVTGPSVVARSSVISPVVNLVQRKTTA
jgi:hypothetical protein